MIQRVRNKSVQATMQIARRLILLSMFLLSGCQGREADNLSLIRSDDGLKTSTIEQFQPRGTLSGHIIINIHGAKTSKNDKIDIDVYRGKNFVAYWISNFTFYVEGDNIDFGHYSNVSYVSPDFENPIQFIVCDRKIFNCSPFHGAHRLDSEWHLAEFPAVSSAPGW